MRNRMLGYRLGLLTALVLAGLPRVAAAHCDTLDGPVVAAARLALAKGDITPVLKWVRQEDEPEIRSAFARTLAVRGKGPDARELADAYFFETLVRVHRGGEGAPYTGLKPAGTYPGPGVAGADAALQGGSVEGLVGLVTGEVAAGIRERFGRAAAARKHAEESVEAGREYVEAYVDYVHYVERLAGVADGGIHHDDPETAAAQHHEH